MPKRTNPFRLPGEVLEPDEPRQANALGSDDPKELSQARKIVNKFGGVSTLAKLVGVSRLTVYYWLRKRANSPGCGGLIPTHYLAKILELARERGIVITSADLDPRATIAMADAEQKK